MKHSNSFNEFSDVSELKKLSKNNPAALRRYIYRRAFGDPFAYLWRKTTFFGRKFYVDRRVYVPNPETEQMVKIALKALKPHQIVIDVGTGSGAIAITLKKEIPTLQVYAVDIDPSALEVARKNARRHKTKILFKESLYVNDLKIKNPDVIVSDMPYGDPKYALPSIDVREFKYMPPISTFHPRGILTAYRELIHSIQTKGWKTTLYFETGVIPRQKVSSIISRNLSWEYLKMKNYSVTIVQFDKKPKKI